MLNFIAPLPQFSCSSSDVSKVRCQIKIWNSYPIWVWLFMKLIYEVATLLWGSTLTEFVNLSRTGCNILLRNAETRKDKRQERLNIYSLRGFPKKFEIVISFWWINYLFVTNKIFTPWLKVWIPSPWGFLSYDRGKMVQKNCPNKTFIHHEHF